MSLEKLTYQTVNENLSLFKKLGTKLKNSWSYTSTQLATLTIASVLAFSCAGSSGAEQEGCKSNSDCKGTRICYQSECVSPEEVPADTFVNKKDTYNPKKDTYSPLDTVSQNDTSIPDKDTSEPDKDTYFQDNLDDVCEWQCDNGKCISSSWVCDGKDDCSNGEDEAEGICGSSGTGSYCDSCNDDSDCQEGMNCNGWIDENGNDLASFCTENESCNSNSDCGGNYVCGSETNDCVPEINLVCKNDDVWMKDSCNNWLAVYNKCEGDSYCSQDKCIGYDCAELINCISSDCAADDLDCQQSCVDNSSVAAQYDFNDLMNCMANNNCFEGDQAQCIEINCLDEYNQCLDQ